MAVTRVAVTILGDDLVHRLAQFFLSEIRCVGGGVARLRADQTRFRGFFAWRRKEKYWLEIEGISLVALF